MFRCRESLQWWRLEHINPIKKPKLCRYMCSDHMGDFTQHKQHSEFTVSTRITRVSYNKFCMQKKSRHVHVVVYTSECTLDSQRIYDIWNAMFVYILFDIYFWNTTSILKSIHKHIISASYCILILTVFVSARMICVWPLHSGKDRHNNKQSRKGKRTHWIWIIVTKRQHYI